MCRTLTVIEEQNNITMASIADASNAFDAAAAADDDQLLNKAWGFINERQPGEYKDYEDVDNLVEGEVDDGDEDGASVAVQAVQKVICLVKYTDKERRLSRILVSRLMAHIGVIEAENTSLKGKSKIIASSSEPLTQPEGIAQNLGIIEAQITSPKGKGKIIASSSEPLTQPEEIAQNIGIIEAQGTSLEAKDDRETSIPDPLPHLGEVLGGFEDFFGAAFSPLPPMTEESLKVAEREFGQASSLPMPQSREAQSTPAPDLHVTQSAQELDQVPAPEARRYTGLKRPADAEGADTDSMTEATDEGPVSKRARTTQEKTTLKLNFKNKIITNAKSTTPQLPTDTSVQAAVLEVEETQAADSGRPKRDRKAKVRYEDGEAAQGRAEPLHAIVNLPNIPPQTIIVNVFEQNSELEELAPMDLAGVDIESNSTLFAATNDHVNPSDDDPKSGLIVVIVKEVEDDSKSATFKIAKHPEFLGFIRRQLGLPVKDKSESSTQTESLRFVLYKRGGYRSAARAIDDGFVLAKGAAGGRVGGKAITKKPF